MNPMRLINDYSDRQIRNSLRAWFDKADEGQRLQGAFWYSDASEICNDINKTTGVDNMTAAAVIAALSPRNRWEKNVQDAWDLCKTWANGGDVYDVTVSTFHANRDKAWRILEGEKDVLASSPKVGAFADTIQHGCLSNRIVVDVWHTRACITKPREGRVNCQAAPTYAQYRRLEDITLDEAQRAHSSPCEFQATIWCTIKDHWEGVTSIDLSKPKSEE